MLIEYRRYQQYSINISSFYGGFRMYAIEFDLFPVKGAMERVGGWSVLDSTEKLSMYFYARFSVFFGEEAARAIAIGKIRCS